jgi:hypothetical protein
MKLKNLLIPQVKNTRKIIPFILLGILIASVYGAIHDQITYAISPEYFTEFKFHQFSYADFSLPDRAYASIVGVLATWWVGMITGWLLGRIRYYSNDLDTAKKDILVGFGMVFLTAFLAAFLGAIIGYIRVYYFPVHSFLGWENELPIEKLKPFIVVGFIHDASYIGDFIGIIYATAWLKKKTK